MQFESEWQRLGCRFARVERVFDARMIEAGRLLSADGLHAYIEHARFIGKMGRGEEPLLAYLEQAPLVASGLGEAALIDLREFAHDIAVHANFDALLPFLQSSGAVARRLQSHEEFTQYIELMREMMLRTSASLHGQQISIPSPGLPALLGQSPRLLANLSLEGLGNWVEYGIHAYKKHPDRQEDYFALQSADAHAVLHRERHGTLLVDHERRLDCYLRALWGDHDDFVPYSLAFDVLRKPIPYYDALGIHLPDVYEADRGVAAIDRYRIALAHMAAHRRWSGQLPGDNQSPFQRIAIEVFEDCRVDHLAIRLYPGLRRLFLALHPLPDEKDLKQQGVSLVYLRLAIFSRAVLDPEYACENKAIREFVDRFRGAMQDGESSTARMAALAVDFMLRTHQQSDTSATIHLNHVQADYRDDNRHLWFHLGTGDEQEMPGKAVRSSQQGEEQGGLPLRHYHEWDYNHQHYRPDWVSVYEAIHPSGDASAIDDLLNKHKGLARRLKHLLESLKPQDRVRIRYQEEGSELDLDVAIRSLIDFKGGAAPDPRINISHRTDGRHIAVLLLLDLSQSLSEHAEGCNQTILELSQEAVSLLAWAIEQVGDPFAIAGFHSDTRHDVRYHHIKGFSEAWDDTVKSRLAAMDAAYSTRMGAAMRHASHYLKAQSTEKKLMLILTDGEPSDIDEDDDQLLIRDARQAVKELDRDGIYTYCINLDAKADEYVADIFGRQYTIVDHLDRLPERLPELFISLTK